VKQSLFSRQVKELEEFFGAELMRRKGRGIVLTAAGERLNVLARECFASLLDFKSGCKGLPVEIVIGAGESLIDWVLMPRLGEVRKKLPNVRLKFLNLATSEIVRRLADGVIDFGVVRKDAVARPLQSVSLGVMGYSLFVPEGLRCAGTGAKALEALPLATLEGEGSFRKELSAIARKNRLEVRIEVECASFPLVARAVGTGGCGGDPAERSRGGPRAARGAGVKDRDSRQPKARGLPGVESEGAENSVGARPGEQGLRAGVQGLSESATSCPPFVWPFGSQTGSILQDLKVNALCNWN
jgi:DNA-binding transcriptional LysR family regulator